MNKQELLNKYTKNYTEEDFFKNNVTYAFSQIQLEEAMEKLSAKDKTELTSIFGYEDICLKSKAKEILQWVINRKHEQQKWLKGLSPKEQNIIIEYELYSHECEYTWNIQLVVDLFKDIFEYNDIMLVFHKITKQ